jgi:hypothetical protein
MNAIGEPDLASAQTRIMKELQNVSEAMMDFIMSFTSAAWQKHFGTEMDAVVCAKTDQSPNFFDVWVPFLSGSLNRRPINRSAILPPRKTERAKGHGGVYQWQLTRGSPR